MRPSPILPRRGTAISMDAHKHLLVDVLYTVKLCTLGYKLSAHDIRCVSI